MKTSATLLDKATEENQKAINTNFLKEWVPFVETNLTVSQAIYNHFSKKPYTWQPSHDESSKQTFRPKSFEQIDNTLGLAYTSSGDYAGLWVCNGGYLWANETYHFNGFSINTDGEIIGIADDGNEHEYFVVLSEKVLVLNTKEDVLNNCKIEKNTVKLPAVQLERELYNEVKEALERIGGKWKGGKVQGFVFPHDPAELLQKAAEGEKINLKKDFQFFGTPAALADKMVQLANIQEGMSVLEPSAGQGAIIEAIYKAFPYYMKGPNDKPCVTVNYFELMPQNQQILSGKISASERWGSCTSNNGDDFLAFEPQERWDFFDRIVANPPFTKNQDIDHIRKMYDCLKPGGRIVTLASPHWQISTQKKESEFVRWLDEIGATIENIPAGTFKESGTSIATVLIIIDK